MLPREPRGPVGAGCSTLLGSLDVAPDQMPPGVRTRAPAVVDARLDPQPAVFLVVEAIPELLRAHQPAPFNRPQRRGQDVAQIRPAGFGPVTGSIPGGLPRRLVAVGEIRPDPLRGLAVTAEDHDLRPV